MDRLAWVGAALLCACGADADKSETPGSTPTEDSADSSTPDPDNTDTAVDDTGEPGPA